MSEYALIDIWTGPDQAKASIQHRLAPFCRSMWEQGIERLTVTVEPEDDAKTVQRPSEPFAGTTNCFLGWN